MAKTKKKLTKEEKLAKDRLRKKEKFAELKSDPERYRIYQEKEKKRYLEKKKNKKVLSIQELSDRAKREQRRRWRKNTQNYVKKVKEQKEIQHILVENTPPVSDTEQAQPIIDVADPLASVTVSPSLHQNKPSDLQSNQRNDDTTCQNYPLNTPTTTQSDEKSCLCKAAVRRIRYRNFKLVRELQQQLIQVKKENNKLQKDKNQQSKRDKKLDTLEKKVDDIIKDIKDDKITQVKRKLLFSESVTKGLTEKYKNINKKDKRPLVEDIFKNREKLLKYRVLSKLPFSLKNKMAEENKDTIAILKDNVKCFFEEDSNSQVAAGKNEYIKRGGIRKQKRYLTDNLKNLHDKYYKQNGHIGYSTFCRYRPFWTLQPNNTRDTCQCKLHANVNLLAKSLNRAKIINEGTATDVLRSLCCDVYAHKCLQRSCQSCNRRVLHYKEFDDRQNIVYFKWTTEKEKYMAKDGTQKFTNATTKKKYEDSPRNVIKMFESMLTTFFKHNQNIVVQYASTKQLKENLTASEIVCHIDFSENYTLKYNEEVQACHFRKSQVSLHTGVLYHLDQQQNLTTKSFCSMSECCNHDASAIWAHLTPVLQLANNLVPILTAIHFISDSPSSQYRNKYIFHMITKLKIEIPTLQEVTWSYLEAGHGKGAPDGVGAVVKRTADNYVKYGGDIGSFEDFTKVVQQNVQNVDLMIIPVEEVTKKRFLGNIPGFKGTTKVHQALWSSDLPYSVAFRSLSCFVCRDSYLPCKHNKHLGFLNTGMVESSTVTRAFDAKTTNRRPVRIPPLGAPISSFADYHRVDEGDAVLLKNLELDITETQQGQKEASPETNTSAVLIKGQGKHTVSSSNSRSEIQKRNVLNNFDNNNEIESPQIDSPTIFNNIGNLLAKPYFDEKTLEENILDLAQQNLDLDITETQQGQTNTSAVLIKDQEKHTVSSSNSRSEIQKRNVLNNFDNNNEIESPQIDSPTIFNNIGNLIAKPYFDEISLEENILDLAQQDPSANLKRSVKILSNEPYDYQRFTVRRSFVNFAGFNSIDQTEYEKFLSSSYDKDADDVAQSNSINLSHYGNDLQYAEDKWVVVEYKLKKCSKYFIGKIINKNHSTREYTIIFVRKARGGLYSWPTVSDEDTVPETQIVNGLEDPQENRRGLFSFKNLPKFNFK